MRSRKLYHYTPVGNIPGILEKGLVPGEGVGTTEISIEDPSDLAFIEEEKSYTYLADRDTIGELVTGAHDVHYGIPEPMEWGILEIEVPQDVSLSRDPSDRWRGGYRTKDYISPTYIKPLGHITVGGLRPMAAVFDPLPKKAFRNAAFLAAAWRHFFGSLFVTKEDVEFWDTEEKDREALRLLLSLPRGSRFRPTKVQLEDLRGYGAGLLDDIIDEELG